jgi:hypothetical protein
MAVLRSNHDFNSSKVGDKYGLYYHGVSWGTSVLMTILPLTTGSFGDTGGWCWIKSDTDTAVAWRFICFYILLWVAFGYNLFVYFKIDQLLKGIQQEQKKQGTAQTKRARTMMDQTKFYPLVLVVCYSFATINRLVETISGSSYLWLSGLHVFFTGLRPLLNAIVIGLTPGVVHLVRFERIWRNGLQDWPNAAPKLLLLLLKTNRKPMRPMTWKSKSPKRSQSLVKQDNSLQKTRTRTKAPNTA